MDLVQNVMMKMWQIKEKLGEVEQVKAYVMRAVKNECVSRLRHRQTAGQHLKSLSKVDCVPENVQGNLANIIKSFIKTLPEKQRMVIHLRDIEEYETTEIGNLLEMDENAVRTNLARARQKVREYLHKIEAYEQRQIQ